MQKKTSVLTSYEVLSHLFQVFQHLFLLSICSLLFFSVALLLSFINMFLSSYETYWWTPVFILLSFPKYCKHSVPLFSFRFLIHLEHFFTFFKISFQPFESYLYPSAWEPRSYCHILKLVETMNLSLYVWIFTITNICS